MTAKSAAFLDVPLCNLASIYETTRRKAITCKQKICLGYQKLLGNLSFEEA
jgi:hypothetical protein